MTTSAPTLQRAATPDRKGMRCYFAAIAMRRDGRQAAMAYEELVLDRVFELETQFEVHKDWVALES